MKIEKISKMALYICIGIIVVCFALFMTIGYNNPVGDTNEPLLTDVVMWLMYLMIIATAILTIWGVICGIRSNKGNDPAASTGVPGGKITLFTIILLIALAGCLGLLIMFIVKFARVKSHPTFKRYGSAASLAVLASSIAASAASNALMALVSMPVPNGISYVLA